MKKKLDIYLGIAAWLIALVTPIEDFTKFLPYALELEDWGVPLAWFVTVTLMIICKQRPLRKLWWVWLSAPFAFLYWIAGMMMFIAWSMHGFGP